MLPCRDCGGHLDRRAFRRIARTIPRRTDRTARLRLDDEVAAAGGFVTALVVVILVVAIAGRVVRKVFHFAGLGVADTLLGIAVSVLKYLLVLSVLFSAFDALNEDYCLVGPRTIERSKSYKPVRWLSESIFPFLEWVGERGPRQEGKTETDG